MSPRRARSVTAVVTVDERRGSAEMLHGTDPFADGPIVSVIVRVCSPTASTLVLGSRQSPELLDADRVAAAGLDVVRRGSGGGAVLLRPDDVVWVDLIVPHGVAPDDVRGSMVWAGERWHDALVSLGADAAQLRIHEGGMVCTPWSALVCFAGLGPGEITVDGRKLVGLSQRRTRHGLRIQGQIHHRDLLAQMPAWFAGPTPSVEIGEVATLGDVGLSHIVPGELAGALARAIETRTTSV